ncbi:MAG: 3-hydroxyacyl-CoA dehydrogenase [Herbiconiux sp.]|nr:3-hydroxyacyl-CoA dehydrogenase [Herbiconiux sp.]
MSGGGGAGAGGFAPVNVTVIGAGLIGCAWAALFARAGHEVVLFDLDEAALGRVDGVVRTLLADLEAVDAIVHVSTSNDLASAVRAADYVQECVPEVAAIKAEVFARIAEHAPADAILASSTSALMPSLFTAEVPERERTLVAHPFNPPHLHTAVELVPAPWTSQAAVARARAILESAGMEPIELREELDGFVVNRLQSAMLHEAFRLVASGAVSAQDVDNAVIGALAPRWSVLGVFGTIDLNAPEGIAQYVERYEELYQRLGAAQTTTVDWQQTLDEGLLAQVEATLPRDALDERRAWRDRQLVALARARRARA